MAYVFYTHRRYDISTLTELVTVSESIFKGYSVKNTGTDDIIRQIMNYDGGTGKKNIERLWEGYAGGSEVNFSSLQTYKGDLSGVSGDGYVVQLTKIAFGTVLVLPIENLNTNLLVAEGNQIVDVRNFNAFCSYWLDQMSKDPDYIAEFSSGNKLLGVTKQIIPNATVWIWCRSLSTSDNDEPQGTILNITPFIEDLDTTVNSSCGTFSIKLPPLICSFQNDKWEIKKDSLRIYEKEKLAYISDGTLSYLNKGIVTRSDFYFHYAISENDIVFIRYEKLKKEANRTSSNNHEFEISKNSLPGNIYDFIGLVDSNSLSVDPQSNKVSINIAGRDLMKLFIEDGCYFYPLMFSGRGMFGNMIDVNGLRRIGTELVGFVGGVQKTIGYALQFIMNALSSIKICPDSLFDQYPSKEDEKDPMKSYKSKSFRMEYGTVTDEEQPTKGIWQIIKLLVDESVRGRFVVDSTIGNENGSILNHINKVCQVPFVEFWGDTYGDQYYFTTRQAPFTKKLMLGLISLINEKTGLYVIKEEDVFNDTVDFPTNAGYSWYRLHPQGMIAGSGSEMAWAFVPAIYFKEFADLWGQRPLEITTNYINVDNRDGNKNLYNVSYLLRQAIFDLKYLIDSHVYLPFTREGTITVNGDRRYKRGTIVYRQATDEFFYVDAVHNSFSSTDRGVVRSTTLTVNRGMVKKHFNRYFEIVNTELLKEGMELKFNPSVDQVQPIGSYMAALDSYQSWAERTVQDWAVNTDILNFFLRRQQFSEEGPSFKKRNTEVTRLNKIGADTITMDSVTTEKDIVTGGQTGTSTDKNIDMLPRTVGQMRRD